MPVQELIHKYEVGAGYRILKILLGFIAIVGLAVVYDVNIFRNMSTAEGMDAAQLARNIADGKGYTTDFIRPFGLYLLKKGQGSEMKEGMAETGAKPPLTPTVSTPDGEKSKAGAKPPLTAADAEKGSKPDLGGRVPDVANAPVYPYLLAGVLKLMPFEYPDLLAAKSFSTYLPDLWIAIFNQVLLVVAACLVFRLARKLFDESVAWVSAVVFAGTELFWRFTFSGTSTLLLTVIFLGVATLLTKLDQGVRETENPVSSGKLLLWAAGVGLLMGLGGMTRYAFLGLMVGVVVWMCFLPTPKRAVLVLTALATFAVVASPWVVRNYSLTGTPFGTASYAAVQTTSQFPEDQLERSVHPDFRLVSTSDYWQKFWTNAREMVQTDLPKFGGNWVAALFLVGFLVPFRNPSLGRLRIFLLICLFLLFVVQAFGRTWVTADSPEINTDNLLVLLAPMAFIFGVGLLFILLESLAAAMRPITLGLFFIITCAPLLLAFVTSHEMTYFPPWIQDKASRVGENETMMTDVPWATAWYGHRQSMWLSLKHRAAPKEKLKEDFYAIHEQERPISALYLTSKTLKNIELRSVAQWVQEEGQDEDWTELSQLATSLAQQLKEAPNKEYFNKLRMLVQLVEKHWVRGDDESWASFLLGIYVNREVPTGFPLKRAPLGLAPEIFLKDSERNSEKPIQSSK